jgi:hypothetical protein
MQQASVTVLNLGSIIGGGQSSSPSGPTYHILTLSGLVLATLSGLELRKIQST